MVQFGMRRGPCSCRFFRCKRFGAGTIGYPARQQFAEYIEIFCTCPPLHLIGESEGLAAVQPGKVRYEAAEFGKYARAARTEELECTARTAAGEARGKCDIGRRWHLCAEGARHCFDDIL